MSEKRKEKKLLNALTLILDLCCKEDVERSGKTKSNIPLEKEFCNTYKNWWKRWRRGTLGVVESRQIHVSKFSRLDSGPRGCVSIVKEGLKF